MLKLRRSMRPASLYLTISAAGGFIWFLIVTVNLVFQVQTIGLNPLQLILVGTVLETTVLVAELPTGLVADMYSRRWSVIVGYALIGLGFILSAIPNYGVILLAQIVWGIGATFVSGAEEAWIADEVGADQAGPLYLRGTQLHQLGALAGIGLSVALAGVRLNLPIFIGGSLYVLLAIVLVVVMPETGFQPARTSGRQAWQALRDTASQSLRTVRMRPALVTILAASAFFGMASEGYDRLRDAHILTNFVLPELGPLQPIVWFGIISAGGMLIAIITTEVARRMVDTESLASVARALAGIAILLVLGVLIFAQTRSFWMALGALWILHGLRGVESPLRIAWINQNVDSNVRATVISMSAQADAFGQIAGGPVVGAIGLARSIRAALTTSALVLLPALGLYGRTVKQAERVISRNAE